MSLFAELRRRNVLRTAAAYGAGSWLLLQIVDTLLPAFDTDASVLRYLIIVLGIGFVPALAVAWIFEWTPEGLQRDENVASSPSKQSRAQARTWDRIIFAVMALALSLFAVDRFVLQPQRDTELVEAATEAGAEQERNKAPEVAHRSIAVLPFVNMSADPDNEYFSDGLTETLLHMLAQLADLEVAARTSAFAFKGKNVHISEIASELRVAHVLEGSVQRSNDRIRVTAQLIRADDGYHVWSNTYDRVLDDVFAIQDEIAAKVAKALGSTLLAGNEDAITGLFTEDISAYDLYLRALDRQATSTHAALEEAEELLFDALERDPEFLDAKLGLVRNAFLDFYLSTGDFEEDIIAREDLLADVLKSNPDNLIAQQFDLRLRSMQAARNADLPLHNQLMNQLLATYQLGNGEPFVRADVAHFLANKGRLDEAEQLIQEALVTDPLNVALLLADAFVVSQTRGPDAAEVPLMTALSLQPDNPHVLTGLFLLENGRQNIVEGLRWGRRLEIADPEDLLSTSEIALALNEVGLYEASELWMEIFRSRTTEPGRIANMELIIAQERGDEEVLERIVPDILDRILNNEIDDNGLYAALIEFVNIMRREGRSQEALDYLDSFYPGITNITESEIDDWTYHTIQSVAVLELLKDVVDDETIRRNFETTISNEEAEDIVAEEGKYWYIWLQNERHGVGAAKEAFFTVFSDDTYILWGAYREFRREPWFTELRKEPEIIEHFRVRQLKVDRVRDEVIELMKESEWRTVLDRSSGNSGL